MTRQLLESSTSLRGATAESWADASRRHADAVAGPVRPRERADPDRRRPRDEEVAPAGDPRPPRRASRGRLRRAAATDRWRLAPPHRRPCADLSSLTIADALRRRCRRTTRSSPRSVAAVADVWGEPSERLQRGGGRNGEARGAAGSVRRSASRTSSGRWRGPSRETEEVARNDPLAFDVAAVPGLQARVARLRGLDGRLAPGRARNGLQDLDAAEAGVSAGLAAVDSCRTELERCGREDPRP